MSEGPILSSSQRPGRRRWGRRLLVAVIVVAVLLVALIITIQVVLSGNLPKRMIVRGLERAMGVRVEVESVSTGWFGRTELRNLALSFPLAEAPFVYAPLVQVEHTHLIPLLLKQPLEIRRAVATDGQLVLLQADNGQWNVHALLGRGSGEDPSGGRRRDIDIPDLDIRNGTVRIIDRNGKEGRFEDVRIAGMNEASFVYGFEAEAPGRIELAGRVNLRDGQHMFEVEIGDLSPALQPLVAAWPQPLNGHGRWAGRVVDGRLQSQLRLERLRVLDYEAEGQVELSFGDGGIKASPDDLTVRMTGGKSPEIELIAGEVRLSDDALVATDLRATTGEGASLLNGRWSFATSAAELEAVWEGLTLPTGLTHSGRLQFDMREELNGEPRISIALDNRGRAPAVQWSAEMLVRGEGPSWDRVNWHLELPRFHASATEVDLALDGLTATIARRGNKLVLDGLALPAAGNLQGQGEIALDGEHAWWLTLDSHRIPVPQMQQASAEVALELAGDATRIEVQRVYGRLGDLELFGSGDYDNRRPKPLAMQVRIHHPTPTGVAVDDQPPLVGGLEGEATLGGTLWPAVDLGFEVNTHARSLRLQRREIGDVDFKLSGVAVPGKVEWQTEELDLLGGRWRFAGDISTARSARNARIRVDVRDMSVKQIADLFKLEGAAGQLGGSWAIEIPRLEPARLTVDGSFGARNVALAPTGKEPSDLGVDRGNDDRVPERGLVFDSAEGRTTYRNRVFEISELVLQQQDGQMSGGFSMNVDQPEVLRGQARFSKWRIDLPGAGAGLQLYGSSELVADLQRRTLVGPVDLAADVILMDQKVGEASIGGRFDGRGLQLPTLQADALGGRLWGTLAFDLDRPLRSSGVVQFSEIDGQAIASLWPAMEGLAGRFAGVAELRPANPENRPIAPLRLTAFVDPTDATFRQGSIGEMTFDAYVDTRAGETGYTDSPLRLVLDRANLHLFGGIVEAWGRFTRHTGGQTSSQANLRFSAVALDQVMHAFVRQDDEPVPGLLDGEFTVVGNPLDHTRAFGQGSARLTRSDLINIDAFAALYNLMNINLRPQEPIGEGEIAFRIEGRSAELTRMRYFNRGVEVRAIGSFQQIWDMPDSPLNVTVVGTARPFKNIKLPFAADVEEVLATLQGDVTTVRVTGTVRDRQIRQLAFQEVGDAMRAILLGDVQREAQRR